MEKGLENFGFREIIVIIFPGLYFFSLLLPINNHVTFIDFNNSIANNVIFILLSLLLGIVLYWVDIPKKIWFFNNNLPTTILIKEFPKIEKFKIINSYFSFYDTISEEQRKKTDTYTSLFHFSVNISIISFALIILYIIFPPFNYGFIAIAILILSCANIIGLFYGERKIKYMFNRQISGYKNSESFKELQK